MAENRTVFLDIPLGSGMDQGKNPRAMPMQLLRNVRNMTLGRDGELVRRVGVAGSLTGAEAGAVVGQSWATPGTYDYEVPAGITELTFKVWGAAGASGGLTNGGTGTFGDGGGGGYATATITVTPGETLKIVVGEGGNAGIRGGSSNVGGTGGSGGGLTGVYRGSVSQANALLVAGSGAGGGGAVGVTTAPDGAPGGGTTGGTGVGPFPGTGGSGATPGTATPNTDDGTRTGSDGAALTGGDGGEPSTVTTSGPSGGADNGGAGGGSGSEPAGDGTASIGGGGGGGAGHAGGGGGAAGNNAGNEASGGGGGSGYDSSGSGTLTAGTGGSPPSTGETEYVSGHGVGPTSAEQDGGDGLIALVGVTDNRPTDDPRRLIGQGDSWIAIGDDSTRVYDREEDEWIAYDYGISIGVQDVRHISGDNTNVRHWPSCASANGHTLHCWSVSTPGAGSSQAYLMVIDDSTGQRVTEVQAVANASQARAALLGSTLTVFYYNGSSGDLEQRSVSVPTGQGSASTVISSSAGYFDVSSTNDGGVIVAAADGGGATVYVALVNSSGTVTQSTTHTAGAVVAGIGCCGRAGQRMYIALTEAAGNEVLLTYNDSLADKKTATLGSASGDEPHWFCMCMLSNTQALVIWADPSLDTMNVKTCTDDTVAVPTNYPHYGTYPVSKPWVNADGEAFCVVGSQTSVVGTTPTSSLAVVRLPLDGTERSIFQLPIAQTVAKSASSYSTISAYGYFHPYSADVFVSSSTVRVSVEINVRGNTFGVFSAGAIREYELTMRPKAQAVRAYDTWIVNCGALFAAGSARLAEVGFFNTPIVADSPQTSGGSVPDGDYRIQAQFEWTDDSGKYHRSSMSDPVTATVSGGGGSGSIDLTITKPWLTRKTMVTESSRPVTTAIYVSGTDLDIPRRYEIVSIPVSAADIFPTPDLSSSGNDTFTIEEDPTALSTREASYADPAGRNLLNHEMPPPFHHIAMHGGRLCGIMKEDRRQVRMSLLMDADFGLAFNAALRVLVYDADKLEALVSMNDVLYAFDQTRIFALSTEGPNNAGASGSFPEPRVVSASVGCSDWRGLVVTPIGCLFPAKAGIHLLSPGGGTTFLVSDNVRDELEAHPVILDVVHDQSQHMVLWVVVDDEESPTSSRLLQFCYNIELGGDAADPDPSAGDWFVWDCVSHPASIAINETAVAYLTNEDSLSVYEFTDGTYTDNGNEYNSDAEVSILRFGGPGRMGRIQDVWFTGEHAGDTTLNIAASTDDAQNYSAGSQDKVISGLSVGDTVEHKFQRGGEAKSFTFRLRQAGTTAGVKLSTLSIEASVEKGGRLHGSSERVG